MNLEITNQNLYLLLPGKVSRVAQIYANDQKIPLRTALYRFYSSDTYKKTGRGNYEALALKFRSSLCGILK